MTNWAFETWPRIVGGALLLSSLFGIVHILGRVVTGQPGLASAATLAIMVLVFGGYVIVGGHLHRNPLPSGE